MKRFLIRYCLAAISLTSLMTSCIEDNITPLTDQGNTFVFFADGTENKLYFSPFTSVQKVNLLTARRNPNSNASLNQSLTLKLTESPAMLKAYNEKNHTSFEWLPSSLYSIPSNANLEKTTDGFSLTFQPGEFAKDMSINLDGSKWDISHKYALAFAVANPTGAALRTDNDSLMVFISVKNAYDGVYRSTGYFTHPTATSSRAISRDKTLTTVDLQTVETEFADLGGSGWLMWLRVNADNTVTIIGKGSTANTLVQTGTNTYDPSTKTYTLNYKYGATGAERVITETIKKK